MRRIRCVEEAIVERYPEQQMRCPVHLCIGQEAVAAGVCQALERDDQIVSGHRSHGHYLAKGGDLKAILADLTYRNLDDEPVFAGKNTTTEFLARAIFDRLTQSVRDGTLGDGARGVTAICVTL
ncbi:MAG: hypothetical protein IH800_17255, partial [Myxococcales bacterium]|nr:hypothetical protein [Myxococcales bacterium]